METKFQTSFIPKTNLDEPRIPVRRAVGFFSFIATIVFLVSILLSAGSFAWTKLLERQKVSMAADLEKNKKAFEPQTIEEYVRLDNRFDNARKLLDTHLSVSAIFGILEDKTLRTVRFADFKYIFQKDGMISIEMTGQGRTYNSIAYQSQVFAKEKALKNPVFSNLDLDEKGNVSFKFTAKVDPKVAAFKNNLAAYEDTPDQTIETGTSTEEELEIDESGVTE